ncbi:MAG: lipopolysaccharide biosynthesis protein [bacterium]
MESSESYAAPALEHIGHMARAGAGWAVCLLVARQVIGIVTTAVTARLVVPADFGLIAMAAAFIQFLTLFDTGLKWSTVQAKTLNADHVTALFWWGVAMGAGMWGISVLGGPVLAWFFNDKKLALICTIMGSGLLLSSVASQPLALMKRQLRVRTVASIETFAVLLSGGVAIVSALAGWGYWALVAQSMTVLLARLVAAWSITGFRPGWPTINGLVRTQELLRFGSLLGASNLVSYFQLYLDSILVGRFQGSTELGFYSRVIYLKTLPSMYAVSALNDVMIPALSGLRGNISRFAEAYRQTLKMVCLVVFPAGACLGIMGNEVVAILYGPQWSAAVPMLRWQASAAMMLPVFHTGAWLLIAGGHGRAQFRLNVWLTCIAVAAYAIAVPYGAIGMSAANGLLFTAVLAPAFLWFAHRAVGISFWVTVKDVWPILLATLLATLAAAGTGTVARCAGLGPFWESTAKLLVGGGFYTLLVWKTRCLPKSILIRIDGLKKSLGLGT